MAILTAPAALREPDDMWTYAVSYRPKRSGDRSIIDAWPYRLSVGQVLPNIPLRIVGDLFVPVELVATYVETCAGRRLL